MKWIRRIVFVGSVFAFLYYLEDPFMKREFKKGSQRLINLHDQYLETYDNDYDVNIYS